MKKILILIGLSLCGCSQTTASQDAVVAGQGIQSVCNLANSITPLNPVEQAACAAASSVDSVVQTILKPRLDALQIKARQVK